MGWGGYMDPMSQIGLSLSQVYAMVFGAGKSGREHHMQQI